MLKRTYKKLKEISKGIYDIEDTQRNICVLLNSNSSKYIPIYEKNKAYSVRLKRQDRFGGFTIEEFTFSTFSELKSFFMTLDESKGEIETIKLKEKLSAEDNNEK